MLTLTNVSYSYNSRSEALHDVSCSVGPGLHLLAGENGAGKTTLLHLMGGLRYPTSGKCVLDGGYEMRLRRPSSLSRVQYFSSQPQYTFPAPTLGKMASRHACFFPSFDFGMLRSNAETFGIGMDDPFRFMSAGTFAKAALAYMLALRCDILLLDEPTIWLDPMARRLFRKMLMESVSSEQAVVISTHDFSEAEAIFDSITVLHHGHILLDADIADIASRLKFITSSSRYPNAVYSEICMGTVRSIVPNIDGDMDSQPDFMLLYSALLSDSRTSLLNLLNL